MTDPQQQPEKRFDLGNPVELPFHTEYGASSVSSYLDASLAGATLNRAGPKLEDVESVRVALQDDFGTKVVGIEWLGNGAMGLIFRGFHTGLNLPVAIKVPDPVFSSSQTFRARFVSEARQLVNIQNNHVVRVFDASETVREKLPYYVMEFLTGAQLGNYIAMVQSSQSPDDHGDWRVGERRKALEYVALIAGGVQKLHDNGIVHRDLKPSNVMLHEAVIGEQRSVVIVPKVIDLGIGKILGEVEPSDGETAESPGAARNNLNLTRHGQIIGSPAYMAPEQRLEDPAAVTTSADIYGLGGILCELLYGCPPIHYLERLASTNDRREFPAALEAIVEKCLRVNPQDRYTSAREVADDIGCFLEGKLVLAYREKLSFGGRITEGALRAAGVPYDYARRRPGVAALLGLAIFSGGVATKQYFDQKESARVAEVERTKLIHLRSDILARAKEREEFSTTLARQNKVGEAFVLLTQELFAELDQHQEVPEIRGVTASLRKKQHEWKLLLELRRVTIEEQEKRINSFELGKFAPLTVTSDAPVKVCLRGEFSDERVAEFVEFIKEASYTRDQHDEVINALGQALLLEIQARNVDVLSLPEDEKKALLLEGLVKVKRLERLLRGVWPGENYNVPGFINRLHSTLLFRLGRRSEVEDISLSGSKWGNCYPTLSFFPDVVGQISAAKSRNMYVLGLAIDASAHAPRNLAAALLAASIASDAYREESTDARRAERLLELTTIYQRLLETVPDNPYLLGQYGRAALALALIQECLPDDDLTLFSGRVIAVETLTKCLDLCQERGITVPTDLRFDAARACILGRYRAERGRIILEELNGQFDDPTLAELLLQRGCAMTGIPLDISFAEKLAVNIDMQQKYPMEAAAIFTRLQAEDAQNKPRWVAALDGLIKDLLKGRPEMQPVTDRILRQTSWIKGITVVPPR